MTHPKTRTGTRHSAFPWHQRTATLVRLNFPRTLIALITLLLLSLGGTTLDAAPLPDPAAPDAILLTLDNVEPRLTTLPTGRAGMMAELIAANNGAVYLLGGYQAGATADQLTIADEVLRYDPVYDELSQLGRLPVGLALAAHVYVPETGLIYLFGGMETATGQASGQPIATTAIRTYDVNTGDVTTLAATLPDPASRASAVYIRERNQIFLFGGVSGTQADAPTTSPPLKRILRFDIPSGAIEIVESLAGLDAEMPGVTWVSAHAVPVSYPAVLYADREGSVDVVASSYILVLGSTGYALFDPVVNHLLTAAESLEVNDAIGAASTFVPGKLRVWSAGGYGVKSINVRCWQIGITATDPTLPRPVGAAGYETLSSIPLPGNGTNLDETQNDAAAIYVPTLDRVLFFGGFLAPTTANADQFCGEKRWPDRPAAATYSRAIYSLTPEYRVAPPTTYAAVVKATEIINPVIGTDVAIKVQSERGEDFAVAIQAAFQVEGQPDSIEMRIVKTVDTSQGTPSDKIFPVTIALPADISPGPEQPDRSASTRGKQVIGICVISLSRTSLPPNCSEVAVTLRPGALQGEIRRDMSGANQSGTQPVAGAILELRDADYDLVATTTTGADGSYSFCPTDQRCLAVGSYMLNLSKPYNANEFPTPADRIIHLPRAIPIEIVADQLTVVHPQMQVTQVLGPTVRTVQAEHNALLGDEIGTFLAFDHLRGKTGIPAIPVVRNTFAVVTEEFTGNDGLDHPEFRTSKVEFNLNGQVLLGALGADGLWQVTYDMSAVLRAGDNTLRITAYDSQPTPSQTSRELTVKAIRGKPTAGQVASYVNLFSIVWSPVLETYTTRIIVPKGFRWPDNPPHELDLILLKLYSQMRADVEIREEYTIAGGWNADGDGGIKVQLLSLDPNEFQMDEEFTVTPTYSPNGIESYVVRSQRYDLCELGLPKCGEWIPIYGKEFSKRMSSGPASLTLTLNLSLSAQYAASLVLQGTLRGDNWEVAEIRIIPRTELGLKAAGEATAKGELEMPLFIPDISFTVSAGAEAEARLFYDQPVVYNPQRSTPVYLDTPCIRFLARAQAWLDLPSPVPDLSTGWWDIIDESWPDNCFIDDRIVNLIRAAEAGGVSPLTVAPPTVMPAPVVAIAPDRSATMQLWIEATPVESGETLTTLTYQVQNAGGSSSDTVVPSGAIADPALLFVTNEKALAVWSEFDVSTAINDSADLAALFKSQEIYAAFWEATTGWSAPMQLTDNTVGDGRPVIATHPASGRAMVVWVRDPDAAEGTAGDLQIVARAWNGTAWEPEKVLIQNSGSANTEPAVAYSTDGAQVWTVWVRDRDANFNTNEDRRLNHAIWDGTQWSAPVEPANWPTGAFSPDLIFSPLSDRPLVTMVARAKLGDESQGTDLGAAGVGNENRLYAAWWGSAATAWDVQAIGDTRAERPQAMLVSADRGLILLRDFGGGDANGLPNGAGQVGAAEGELNPDGARWVPPGVLTQNDTPIWQVSGSSVPLGSANDADFGLNLVAVSEARPASVNAVQATCRAQGASGTNTDEIMVRFGFDAPPNCRGYSTSATLFSEQLLVRGARAAVKTVGLVDAYNLGGNTTTGVFELQPATDGVDIAVEEVHFSNLMPESGELVTVTVRVRSTTVRPMSESGNTRVPVFLYLRSTQRDAYMDLQEYKGELLFNESKIFHLTYLSSGGPDVARIRVDYDGDLDTSNDTVEVDVGLLPGPQAVQIREDQSVAAAALRAGPVAGTKVTINWSPPTLEAGRSWSYRIYRGPSAAGPWTLVGYSTRPAFVDAMPAAGELYYAIEAADEFNHHSAKSIVTLARFLPETLPDISIVQHNMTTVVDVLQNDSDKDGDPLVITAVTQGAHGTVTNMGSRVSYTPQAGYAGVDTFGYTVADEQEGAAEGTVTVLVDQAVPTITINDVTVNENAGNAVFTVRASRSIDVNIDLTVLTSDGTATQIGDYQPISDTVTIKSGTTTAFFSVPITDDQIKEDDETFTVNLSQPIHATLADGQGVVTILGNDGGSSGGGGNEKLYLPLINR